MHLSHRDVALKRQVFCEFVGALGDCSWDSRRGEDGDRETTHPSRLKSWQYAGDGGNYRQRRWRRRRWQRLLSDRRLRTGARTCCLSEVARRNGLTSFHTGQRHSTWPSPVSFPPLPAPLTRNAPGRRTDDHIGTAIVRLFTDQSTESATVLYAEVWGLIH